MKTIIKLTLAAALTAGTIQAFAQADDPLARLRAQRAQELQQSGTQPADTAPAESAPSEVVPAPVTATDDTPPQTESPVITADQMVESAAGTNASASLSTNGITFNFRNAPLDLVLTHMSDAAGFIIVLDTPVRGNVSVISSHPMTKDEAVDLLNTVLNQNGYAAIRDDQTLTIMTKSDAIHRDIPVKVNNDPNSIPNNDEIVTQIIPIRFVDAQQLVVDLSSFVSPQATIVANQAGNSIVITDTQSNIRHLTEIIKAIDSSAEMETVIRVFPLKHANPNDVVTMLQGVFPGSSGGTQNPVSFGGGRAGRFAALFGGGGPAGGGAATGAGTSQARIQKAQQVIAVADARTQSVVVTASKDMMDQIDEMIRELDVDSTRDQNVYVMSMHNADPYQAAQVLQNMFGSGTTRNGSTQTSPLMTREQQSTTTSGTSTTGFGTSSGGGGSRNGNLF